MSSADALNLDKAKILLSGKGLSLYQTIKNWNQIVSSSDGKNNFPTMFSTKINYCLPFQPVPTQ